MPPDIADLIKLEDSIRKGLISRDQAGDDGVSLSAWACQCAAEDVVDVSLSESTPSQAERWITIYIYLR